jgi:aspartate/methionine/tyrosine aminotransferase
MLSGPFDALPPSPFARLRALLDATAPPQTGPQTSLALGEPQHAPPAFVLKALSAAAPADYGRYPPIGGTPDWRAAVQGWLERRFGVPPNMLSDESQILPVAGTREGLFLAAQLAPEKHLGLIAMPNPFYQVYASAAVAAGATPFYLNADAAHGFLPDLDALSAEVLARLRAVYLCSPANPQGAIADKAYLAKAYQLAKQYGFLLLVDECYSDIYDDEAHPPPSILQTLHADGAPDDAPVLVFHSLSKRSNLAGLRSGFVTGGRSAMAAFYKMRMVAAPQTPLPTLAAAALAWGDDAHVVENRAAYRQKIDAAEAVFGTSYGFYRPAGGFFLWLTVGDGEAAAKTLWREAGLRVLPGAYLTQSDSDENRGAAYIRVALVAPLAETKAALARLKACLDAHGFGGAHAPDAAQKGASL